MLYGGFVKIIRFDFFQDVPVAGPAVVDATRLAPRYGV